MEMDSDLVAVINSELTVSGIVLAIESDVAMAVDAAPWMAIDLARVVATSLAVEAAADSDGVAALD